MGGMPRAGDDGGGTSGLGPTVLVALLVISAVSLAAPLDGVQGDQSPSATIPVGANPDGIGTDPATNMVYVANSGDSSVSVIDGSTDSVLAAIPIGVNYQGFNSPCGVAANPLTDMIYVVLCSANYPTVAVIDGSTNTIVRAIHLPFHASGTFAHYDAVDPATNMVYVTVYANEHLGSVGGGPYQVAVINGATSQVVSMIDVGSSPNGIAVDPSTNRIYVTDGAEYFNNSALSDAITVIDGSTDSIVANVSLPSTPSFVAVNPATDTVFVTMASNQLAAIDGATNTLIGETPVGSGPLGVDLNPNTDEVYVADGGSDAVTVVDGASDRVLTNEPVGSQPHGVGVDPATGVVYTTDYGSNAVSVIKGMDPTSTAVACQFVASLAGTMQCT